MIKKIVVSTLLLGLVGGIALGTDADSYVTTAFNRATNRVEKAVPIEFQLDRARHMVSDLAPEVRRSMEVIAREEIELERLAEQIGATKEKADKSEEEILRLQADLGSERDVFHYAGHAYERGEVVEDLSRRFTRHKLTDQKLEHLQKMHAAREGKLHAARENLTSLASAQKELEAEIENLEAQRQLVEVAQASSDVVALDESQLAKAKGLIADIRSRLDVAARLANAEDHYPSQIQLDPAESQDVTKQVASYFGLDKKSDGKVAAASASVRLD
ncbi:hypothetical protein [Botrimarina sp.]|uniref:hypothetical protein n=1 Tax=Botrimarina sp. TaxID=2795802 RepID=UPI0032EC504E